MISIDWAAQIINVPQSHLTPVGGNVYELDAHEFFLDIKALEASEEGQPFPDAVRHNAAVSLSGIVLGHVVQIINDYTVTFEDGQYAVNIVGANTNISEVTNINQVSVRSYNSAGLQIAGSGITNQDKEEIVELIINDPRFLSVGKFTGLK